MMKDLMGCFRFIRLFFIWDQICVEILTETTRLNVFLIVQIDEQKVVRFFCCLFIQFKESIYGDLPAKGFGNVLELGHVLRFKTDKSRAI